MQLILEATQSAQESNSIPPANVIIMSVQKSKPTIFHDKTHRLQANISTNSGKKQGGANVAPAPFEGACLPTLPPDATPNEAVALAGMLQLAVPHT